MDKYKSFPADTHPGPLIQPFPFSSRRLKSGLQQRRHKRFAFASMHSNSGFCTGQLEMSNKIPVKCEQCTTGHGTTTVALSLAQTKLALDNLNIPAHYYTPTLLHSAEYEAMLDALRVNERCTQKKRHPDEWFPDCC